MLVATLTHRVPVHTGHFFSAPSTGLTVVFNVSMSSTKCVDRLICLALYLLFTMHAIKPFFCQSSNWSMILLRIFGDLRKPTYRLHVSVPMYNPMKLVIVRQCKCYLMDLQLHASSNLIGQNRS